MKKLFENWRKYVNESTEAGQTLPSGETIGGRSLPDDGMSVPEVPKMPDRYKRYYRKEGDKIVFLGGRDKNGNRIVSEMEIDLTSGMSKKEFFDKYAYHRMFLNPFHKATLADKEEGPKVVQVSPQKREEIYSNAQLDAFVKYGKLKRSKAALAKCANHSITDADDA